MQGVSDGKDAQLKISRSWATANKQQHYNIRGYYCFSGNRWVGGYMDKNKNRCPEPA